jgi:hypothetical protein
MEEMKERKGRRQVRAKRDESRESRDGLTISVEPEKTAREKKRIGSFAGR